MTGKSLATCVLLLGLVLGAAASAHADTIAITSVSLNNLQIVPTSGTVVLSAPQAGQQTAAGAAATNNFDEESGSQQEGPTHSQANASVTFATSSAVSDFPTLSLNASNNVTLSGCTCSGETEAVAFIRASFMITGGTGNVDVTISGLLHTVQTLMTDQFSQFAVSRARFNLQVSDGNVFSFDSNVRIGPNDSNSMDTQTQLSQVLTLVFGQQYNLLVFIGADSRAAESVPEPATVVLLFSGLGFMTGLVRKQRLR